MRIYAECHGPKRQFFSDTVAGAAVDDALQEETIAEHEAAANPTAPLTRSAGLDAATWYGNMNTTIGDTRKVADT